MINYLFDSMKVHFMAITMAKKIKKYRDIKQHVELFSLYFPKVIFSSKLYLTDIFIKVFELTRRFKTNKIRKKLTLIIVMEH